jgi:hypothetical protein
VGVQKTRILIGIQTIKTVFMTSQMKISTLGSWTRGYVRYTLTKNLLTFFPCSESLWKAEPKSDRLGWGHDSNGRAPA